MLTALVVLGLVLVQLHAATDAVIWMWRAQSRQLAASSDLEPVTTALRRLIRAMDPAGGTGGGASNLTADGASFATRLPRAASPGTEDRAQVTLTMDAGNLVLRWSRLRHVVPFSPEPAGETTVLLAGIRRLELSYRGGGPDGPGWVTGWTDDRLPSLMRIRVVLPDGDARRWVDLIETPDRELGF